jgi:dihydrofolate synthase/folylpolyglutamate synthase
MYQRVGKAAYKADLSNTYALCELLGNPHHQIRSIHIAGTNGKGSVAHILASILQSAGMKVGLHTSPHFKDFRERIRINGNMISKSDVIQFVEQNQEGLKRIQPSFFEMAVVMAFDHFAKQKVDVAVVETGMGGRLDSTNVLTPLISIITNIGLDHIQFLGNTLEKIAVEKAGIIKSGVPVVIGECEKETKQVFLKVAGQRRAPLYFADTNLTVPETDLKGAYQKKNIITSLKAMEVLKKEGMAITSDHIVDGLKKVIENTGFMGRWQVLQSSPTVICDAGHNLEGIQLVQQEIKEADYNKLHFVLGFVNDKDIDSLLELLPKEAEYYYCKADIPRGMDAHALARKTEERGLQGNVYPSVLEAFHAAKENARKDDMVFIGGSTFVVAEVL